MTDPFLDDGIKNDNFWFWSWWVSIVMVTTNIKRLNTDVNRYLIGMKTYLKHHATCQILWVAVIVCKSGTGDASDANVGFMTIYSKLGLNKRHLCPHLMYSFMLGWWVCRFMDVASPALQHIEIKPIKYDFESWALAQDETWECRTRTNQIIYEDPHDFQRQPALSTLSFFGQVKCIEHGTDVVLFEGGWGRQIWSTKAVLQHDREGWCGQPSLRLHCGLLRKAKSVWRVIGSGVVNLQVRALII